MIAPFIAVGSSTSAITASAPNAATTRAEPGERASANTTWPRSRRKPIKGRPMAPVAPPLKTRIVHPASSTPLHAYVNKIYSVGRGVAFASATAPSENLWDGLLAESAAHRLPIFSFGRSTGCPELNLTPDPILSKGHRNRPSSVVYAAGWRGPMPTTGRSARASHIEGGANRRCDAERAVHVEEPMGLHAPAQAAPALGEPRINRR